MEKSMSHRRAFTLIELLVVIAIIAILAAILFPVFAQAKLAAKKTSSLSNIKQTALGVLMYMNDSDDVYPAGSGRNWFYPRDGGWSWNTQPYIKSLAILRDPSDPLSTQNWRTWMMPPNNPTVSISYASNGFFWQDRNNGWSSSMNGVMGMAQDSWVKNAYMSASGVNKPADTIMLCTRASGNNLFGMGDLVGISWWDDTGAGEIPDGGATGSYSVSDGKGGNILVNNDKRLGAVYTPYSNQSPFVFCDGHARSMNPIATDPNPHKTYVHAPDYSYYPSGHDPANIWDAVRGDTP